MNYLVDEAGYFGEFGGAYIPEVLQPNIRQLRENYFEIISDGEFQGEFLRLLRDYAGRPTPLYLAERLSDEHCAQIFLKREDLLHTGAHKINNTIGQILLAKRLGRTRIIAETGAGQHGVATATVCALMGMECVVYMGEVDVARQAPNVARMKMLGAEVVPVTSGSKTLKDATNEAMRDLICNPTDTHYLIGSVVGPHPYPDMVAMFHAVTSQEIRQQLDEAVSREVPDYVVACVGGGSNAIGAFWHYLDEEDVQLVGVEASGDGVASGRTAATITLGTPGVLHGTKTLILQDQHGQIQEAHSLAAGLDYPGVGPQHAHLARSKRATYLSVDDTTALKAAHRLAQLEGIIPAVESAHALAALDQLQLSPETVVVVNLSGRGDKDMETYTRYLENE